MEQTTPHTAPVVSVIMPAYNSRRFITEAIRSVQAQSFTDWELLVIDDGSQDDTCAIVEKLAAQDTRIRLIRNEQNMGVARTRNRGFDLCRGQYIALLDSDDMWHPEKLQRQLERLKQSGADIAYCSYAIVDASGAPAKADYIVPQQVDFDGLLKENVIGCSTVVLRRKVTEHHRFRTDFYHEDYALWLDLLRTNLKAVGCSEPLVSWRLIADSRSYNKGRSARNRWRIYRQHLHLPLGQSLLAFSSYAAASLRKYAGKHR